MSNWGDSYYYGNIQAICPTYSTDQDCFDRASALQASSKNFSHASVLFSIQLSNKTVHIARCMFLINFEGEVGNLI